MSIVVPDWVACAIKAQETAHRRPDDEPDLVYPQHRRDDAGVNVTVASLIVHTSCGCGS